MSVSEAFLRLSPALQYQIVNGLGFGSLRPIQERAIDAILPGNNCVILAPTAGGKTESAFFPLLSMMDREDWRPVSVLYVTPLRALLNNQEPRLERYAALLGRRSFKWHGDVGDSARRQFIAEPADILLTTPESLEVMLMSPSIPARRLFANLRAVVIDEVHAFVADDRGGHLASLLERIGRYCGHDVQRIALSATVGNPDEILRWVAGSSQRPRQVVAIPPPLSNAELSLDFVGSRENAARVIAALHPGRKRLVFVDSRRGVEEIGKTLHGLGVSTYVTHSSLSVKERERAERAFAEERDCVIVATSALELGIDIGDLDHVIQVDCPSTVASFLQRMGRSGRRPDTRPNCTFLATEEDALLQSAALLRLHRAGYVEPLSPSRRAAHLYAHQVLALSVQESGIPRGDINGWLGAATPFEALTIDERSEIVEHMLRDGILIADGGRLSLGPRGEKLYGKQNFLELYAVFSTPETFVVLHGAQEVGSVETKFLEQQAGEEITFTLGGQAWRVSSVDWRRGAVYVKPSEYGRHARWRGRPILLHTVLCQAMRDVLVGADDEVIWSRRARERIRALREEYAFLQDGPAALVPTDRAVRLWTFAGGKANYLLARTLDAMLGESVTASNQYVSFQNQAAESEVSIRNALTKLLKTGRPDESDAIRFAEGKSGLRLSKFQPCLPKRQEAIYLAEQLTDPKGARQAVAVVASTGS